MLPLIFGICISIAGAKKKEPEKPATQAKETLQVSGILCSGNFVLKA